MGPCSAKSGSPNKKVNQPLPLPNEAQGKPGQQQQKDVNLNGLIIGDAKIGRITKDYTLLNPPLGKGAYGEVRKAIHKQSGMMRAVKIIHKAQTNKEEQERLMNEVSILRRLDHPNIIKIYEFYQDDKFFYIVTELCTGGELFDKITEQSSFSEIKAAEIIKQVLQAIFYCHQEKIVHRDLKPENLIYESEKEGSTLKVIDFGTSREFDLNQKLNQKMGTPYYIAPEVIKRKYDEKCDIWSCGVILYLLLCGLPPFSGKSDEKIMEKVSKGHYSFDGEEWDEISKEAKELIKKMLQYDPIKRNTAEQCLQDPWIKKYTSNTEVEVPLMKRILVNMQNFRAQQKLQEATFRFIVNYLATKEEKTELLKTFQALDLNNDGKLSKEELILGYNKLMNAAEAEEEVTRIMMQVDKNNSGAIDYSEFVMATIDRRNLLSKQRLETTFKMFDKVILKSFTILKQDGSGSISIDELKEIFGGSIVSEEMWVQIVQEVDKNSDGLISLQEFKDMMGKLAI